MTARPLHLTIYRAAARLYLPLGRKDGWRWTLKAANGKIIDASTEAYTRRAGLDANLLQAHGLDVRWIKPGEMVVFERVISSYDAADPYGVRSIDVDQTIKVTVTP